VLGGGTFVLQPACKPSLISETNTNFTQFSSIGDYFARQMCVQSTYGCAYTSHTHTHTPAHTHTRFKTHLLVAVSIFIQDARQNISVVGLKHIYTHIREIVICLLG